MQLQSRARLALVSLCIGTAAAPALADRGGRDYDWYRDKGRHQGSEFKEKYRDGLCKIEREMKRDGRYKQEVECKGAHHGYGHSGERESEQKYWDGPCRIEREVKRDGSFKEKIDCRG